MRYLRRKQLLQDTRSMMLNHLSLHINTTPLDTVLKQNNNVVILLRRLFDPSNHITTVYHNKRPMTYLKLAERIAKHKREMLHITSLYT